MPIPELIVNSYYLPPGEHLCTLGQAAERFAGPNSSEQRKKVWRAFKRCLDRLIELELKPEVILINGSFVTGRECPGDVDCACVISPDVVRKALKGKDDSEKQAIRVFLDTKSETIVRILFGAHIMIADSEESLRIWSRFFRLGGSDGLKNPDPTRDPEWVTKPREKGILRVELKGGT